MYETHFGLKQRPFWPTPDCESYYPATTHEQALARILRAIDDQEGMVLLTGQPGVGKTLLCHLLLERLGPDTVSAFLINCHLADRTALLQAVLYELSLPYKELSQQEMRLALTECLLQNFAAKRRTVIVVDEAQHLSPDLLEELRLLGNLEAPQSKALQVVLVSQPTILETLCSPELAMCRQRLAVRVRLDPLEVNEAADYLLHHLRQAGGRPERIFADEALELLARGAQGVPRLLNQGAHQALTLSCSAGVAQVDAEAVLEALVELGLEVETASSEEELQVVADPLESEAGQDGIPEREMMLLKAKEPSETGRLFTTPPRPAG